jgi:hypothetical protein
MTDKKQEQEQCTIPFVRRSCSCGKSWAIDTNKYIEEHEPFVCIKCGGYVTIDQIPEGMKFKERLGSY